MFPSYKKRRVVVCKFTYSDLADYLGTSQAYIRQFVHRNKLNLRQIKDVHKLLDYFRAKKTLKS